MSGRWDRGRDHRIGSAIHDAAFAQLYQAWLDYNVIVVRNQRLATDNFLAYSRRFGLLADHPSKNTCLAGFDRGPGFGALSARW
jgi:alpha-ketoglutarate-dependent taurine dioxygenase